MATRSRGHPGRAPGRGQQPVEQHRGHERQRAQEPQRSPPRQRLLGKPGDQPAGDATEGVARDVDADRGAEVARVHLVAEVSHRHRHHCGQCDPDQRSRHQQHPEGRRQRTADRQQAGGEQAGTHHPGTSGGLGDRRQRQDRQRQRAGGRRHREAGCGRTDAEAAAEGGQQRLGGVEQAEGGQGGEQHRQVQPSQLGAPGSQPPARTGRLGLAGHRAEATSRRTDRQREVRHRTRHDPARVAVFWVPTRRVWRCSGCRPGACGGRRLGLLLSARPTGWCASAASRGPGRGGSPRRPRRRGPVRR